MIKKAALISGCLLLFLSCFTAEPARADYFGSVVLKSGERYDKVPFKLIHEFKALRVDFEGEEEEKYVSYSDVEAIFDENGNNIAPEILGRWYHPSEPSELNVPTDSTVTRPPPDAAQEDTTEATPPTVDMGRETTWRRENDPIYIKAREKYWDVAFCGAVTYDFPSGAWYVGINSGVGFEGSIMLSITQNVAFRFSISKPGLNVDDDITRPLRGLQIDPDDPSVTITDASLSLDAYRYFFSFAYYDYRQRSNKATTMIYFWTGLGAIQHQTNLTVRVTDSGGNYVLSDSESKSFFSLAIGFGYVIGLSKVVGMDIGAEFDLFNKIEKTGNVSVKYEGYIFDFRAGLTVLL